MIALGKFIKRCCENKPVTTVSLLLAVPGEVSGAVALEALFALAAEASIARGHAALRTFAGEVPRPVAFVAYA